MFPFPYLPGRFLIALLLWPPRTAFSPHFSIADDKKDFETNGTVFLAPLPVRRIADPKGLRQPAMVATQPQDMAHPCEITARVRHPPYYIFWLKLPPVSADK